MYELHLWSLFYFMSDHSKVILDTYIHTKVMKTCHTHPQSTTPVRPDADDELQQSIHRVIDTQLDLVASSVGGDHQLSATGEVLQVDAQLQIGAQVNLQAMISVVTLSLHTLFLPVTHSLHTLFLPVTHSLHTLFLPLTLSLHTLFLPLTLSLHTLFLPLTQSAHPFSTTHSQSAHPFSTTHSQSAHPFSTTHSQSAHLFSTSQHAWQLTASSLTVCTSFFYQSTWRAFSKVILSLLIFYLFSPVVPPFHCHMELEICSLNLDVPKFRKLHCTFFCNSVWNSVLTPCRALWRTVCLPHAELSGKTVRLPHAELWGELCAYPMQSCGVNCVLTHAQLWVNCVLTPYTAVGELCLELWGELCAYPCTAVGELCAYPIHSCGWTVLTPCRAEGELCAYPMQSCEVNCVLTPCRTVRWTVCLPHA